MVMNLGIVFSTQNFLIPINNLHLSGHFCNESNLSQYFSSRGIHANLVLYLDALKGHLGFLNMNIYCTLLSCH